MECTLVIIFQLLVLSDNNNMPRASRKHDNFNQRHQSNISRVAQNIDAPPLAPPCANIAFGAKQLCGVAKNRCAKQLFNIYQLINPDSTIYLCLKVV